jgi:prepilin-type N-terminal cleavage/methylation domain-containing protein
VRWSATCRRAEPGFTLIELVVALAVVALGLSFVLPRLTQWVDRLAFSLRQQRFEEALARLGGEAKRSGRTIVLNSVNPAGNAGDPPPAIELPSGWIMTVEPPIAFRYDGLCTGGIVRLRFPAGMTAYRLEAPYCRPEAM